MFLHYGFNTARNAVVGAALGGTAAVLCGAALAPIRWVARPVMAYAAMVQATPLIVLTPLATVWLGDGDGAKVFVVAVASFPIMFVATVRGLELTPPRLEALMASYAATRTQVFLRIRLPSALPSVLSGLKVTLSSAMIIAIVAELFGGSINSLGTYMHQEALFYHTSNVWAAAFTAVLYGLVLYSLAALAERVWLHWHPSVRARQAQTVK
jgi:ABC-type nitrate/sulfonate/bicarbonate transport system permease component